MGIETGKAQKVDTPLKAIYDMLPSVEAVSRSCLNSVIEIKASLIGKTPEIGKDPESIPDPLGHFPGILSRLAKINETLAHCSKFCDDILYHLK